MSLASTVGTVKYTKKLGVYMPAIMSNEGDLYQEYSGTLEEPYDITPDFTELTPILSFIVTSSRVSEGVVTPNNGTMKWFFNDIELIFQNGISTNNLGGETGHFKFVPIEGTNYYYGLQILKNIVKASEGASAIIKAQGEFSIGNTSDTISLTYGIPITKSVGKMTRVTIAAADNNAFTIREKGGSCKLKAVARQGNEEITTGLTYKWYESEKGVWSELAETSKILTVTEDMVDTTNTFKVEVFQNGSLLGLDTQTVMDVSDPFDILPRPEPEDETISSKGDTVVYTPWLVKRGDVKRYKEMTFYFMFFDSAGNILNPGTSETPAATGTCTYDMCEQAGSDVNYEITTSE